jgi:hypothetical protein
VTPWGVDLPSYPPIGIGDGVGWMDGREATLIEPSSYFEKCEFCSAAPAHIQCNNGSQPLGGFDASGLPRTEGQLLNWLQSLLVAEIPWPDDLRARCDEHLYHRLNPDGELELSPSGRAVQAHTASIGRTVRPRRGAVRQQVIQAYGGQCGVCEDTENLQVCRLPDTEALLHPNGTKMKGEDKYRRLTQLGFPPGWILRCTSGHPAR